MVAMVFTAMSYGRMARVYPSAGSAYTYVGRETASLAGLCHRLEHDDGLHSQSIDLHHLVLQGNGRSVDRNPLPASLSRPVLADHFRGAVYCLNLRGVKTSARINQILCAIMGAVIVAFFWYTIRYIFHLPQYPEAYFLRPFYNPQTFTINRVFHGTSVAVLTYIGFDGISTLSEEVDNPKRNIFLATVLVCVITGFLAAAEVYGAQLLSSQYYSRRGRVENAFSHVAAIAGGL